MKAIVFRAIGIACVMACLFAIAPDRCQRTLVGQLDADGFVYADTPIHTDADLTVECFLGRFTDAVDGCAAGELDGRLGPWIIARILGWRSDFLGHWRSLSAVCTQKERSLLTIISL